MVGLCGTCQSSLEKSAERSRYHQTTGFQHIMKTIMLTTECSAIARSPIFLFGRRPVLSSPRVPASTTGSALYPPPPNRCGNRHDGKLGTAKDAMKQKAKKSMCGLLDDVCKQERNNRVTNCERGIKAWDNAKDANGPVFIKPRFGSGRVLSRAFRRGVCAVNRTPPFG